jgi:four helix bundle protein
MAETVQELKVWQRAFELGSAVNAILEREAVLRGLDVGHQLGHASDSVAANIAEGFTQQSDKAFVRYLYIAKSSNAETRNWLRVALARRYITQADFTATDSIADETGRMITGLIKYLVKCDRRNRGLGPMSHSGTGLK